MAVVGPQMGDADLGGRGELEPDDVGGEPHGGIEIGDPERTYAISISVIIGLSQANTGARSM